jgi:uncharacterized protein (DUF1800 family)
MATQSPEWIAASRVVRRTGFGSTGAVVDAAVKSGVAAFVADALAADPVKDPGAARTPLPEFTAIAKVGPDADTATRRHRNSQVRAELVKIAGWWVQRMAAAQQPFGERLTFYWHDHFATAASKVRSAPAMAKQNATLRTMGRGDFRDLAQAMLVDPAMLIWLDGQKNTVSGANENLSREFMELFTLGHADVYTEDDVRSGARALTGWRIDDDLTTRLVPRRHDNTIKTFLGVIGDLDQVGYGDAVLAEPGCARFIASRLYNRFVSDNPPASTTVDRLVAAYGPQRDLMSLLNALFTDTSFAAATGSIVVGPLEWLLGVVRTLKIEPDQQLTPALLQMLRQLGQLPFYPPNVGGWPTGRAWLSSAAADLRLQYAARLTQLGDLSAITAQTPGDRIDAAGYLLGVGAWSARSVAAMTPLVNRPATLIAVAVNAPEYLVH